MSVAPARLEDNDVNPVDDVAEARGALREAFASRAKLTKALDKAKAASARAKALVSELEAEVERHVGAGRRVTAMRTEDLKATLKAGKAPSFEVLAEVPAIEAKRLEAESRLEAAKAAEEELKRDESEAEGALAAAEAAIKEGIKAVMLAEAGAIADRILDLEAEADELRLQIGIYGYSYFGHSFPPVRGSPLSAAMSGQVWGFNSPEMKRSAAHQIRWRALAKALETDASAELSFDD